MGQDLPLKQPQDTVLITVVDSLGISDSLRLDTIKSLNTTADDSIQTRRTYSLDEIEAILEKAERRNQEIDSIRALNRRPAPGPPEITPVQQTAVLFDSTHIIFAYDTLSEWPEKNILSPIRFKKFSRDRSDTDFFLYDSVPAKSSSEVHPQVVSKSNEKSPDWFLGIFLLMLLILARIRLFYGKFISPIVISLVNSQVTQNLFRNRNILYERANVGFTSIFILSTSLFLYQASRIMDLEIMGQSGFWSYLIITALILSWYFVRFMITTMVGYISNAHKLFREYFHVIALSVRSIGLFLIPVTLILAYLRTPHIMLLIYTGLFIIVVAYVLRVVRLFGLFINKRISVLYSILYLCALEILPTLVIYRLVFPFGYEMKSMIN